MSTLDFPKPGRTQSPCHENASRIFSILASLGGKLPDQLPVSLSSLLIGRYSDLVREMVRGGASVHAVDQPGFTPLRCATLFGSPEVVQCLLD